MLEVKRNPLGLRYRWLSNGVEYEVGRDQMLHVAGWGFNGIVGQSVIGIARESVGLGLANDEFANRFFSNSATPSGIITMPPEYSFQSEEQKQKYLEALKKQVAGLGKAHNIMLLGNAESYQQMPDVRQHSPWHPPLINHISRRQRTPVGLRFYSDFHGAI